MNLFTKIRLYVSGVEFTVQSEDVTPETTLNMYLREKVHLTGTKKMCLEGGCGSCIVAVEEIVDGKRIVFAINSCLVSIFSCHNWKIHTIEGIGGPTSEYHPIQKILADNNGTQCGYCSPGMVMNMYALLESGPITKNQIENSFGGNLCRCTGYRPILTAFRKLATDASNDEKDSNYDIEDVKPCRRNCVKKCEENCKQIKKDKYYYQLQDSKWMKVYYLKDLLELLRNTKNSYRLVAGNTARGVYRNTTTPDLYIDISGVHELTSYSMNTDVLVLGGNITLTKATEIFSDISKETEEFAYLANMAAHIDLVANIPVRNIGTLAGNLMIKYAHNDFPSDIFLLLETYNASLVIVDTDENEITTAPKDFLKMDMEKKVIKSIILNGLDSSHKYLSYKIMARAQNTYALVNAGFLIKLDIDGAVESARIVYGAINSNFVHAEKTEKLLKGKHLFNNSVLRQIFASLNSELVPDYILPESKPEFRKMLAMSLFYKFVLNVAPENIVSKRLKSGGYLLQRPVSTGRQEFGTIKRNYPLSQPIPKIEALAQTSGQAEYIADIPDLPNQLFAAFVTANAEANSYVLSIDPTEALKLNGVVAFFDKSDIPGENTFTPKLGAFTVQEELFCSGQVQYYNQPLGVIVANKQEIALEAAELVKVTYSAPTKKPLLTIKDVLKAKAKDKIKHQSTIVPRSKGKDIKHVIKGQFYIGLQYHFHMEVQCCNVVPTEDTLDLYPSTQWMDLAQIAAAAMLNIPMNKINVFVRRLGGGFGAKISRNSLISTAAALAAYKLKKPVKMWLPLEKNMDIVGKRIPLLTHYEAGVNEEGVIQYMDANLYSDFGVGGNEPVDSLLIDLFENCYDISTWSFSTYMVATDTHPNCWTRAPGSMEGIAAIESIMEHIASSINLDPVKVKEANMNKNKYPKVMEFWKDMQVWGEVQARKMNIKSFNEANRWKKRGMSLVPMAWTLEVDANYTVLVSIYHGDGSVAVSHGGIEMGQGINTKVAQVCAYKFGIPLESVAVRPSYSVIAPNSSTSGGSLTSEAVCYALIKACDVLLERIKPVRNKMVNPKWADLINACFHANVHLSASAFYSQDEPDVQSYLIYGVCASEVEVDILTGQMQILRVDIIEDIGDSMSPLIDIGQVEGAFVMGIGYYTTEELIFNEEGKLLTNRSWNYRPPGFKDIPINFRIKFPENNPNPVGVLKSKAVAEPPICISISIPLAIRHAVASARHDADPSQPLWYPMDGPSTVENTLLNTLNSYNQYVL